jgi:hypothetical protein
MPLKSETVEAASFTLSLLEELNRHRATSITSSTRIRFSVPTTGCAALFRPPLTWFAGRR